MVKDARIESRNMTNEEKELYKCDEYEQWLMSGGAKGQGSSGTSGYKKLEKGVKITVKTKEDEKKEEEEQQLKEAQEPDGDTAMDQQD